MKCADGEDEHAMRLSCFDPGRAMSGVTAFFPCALIDRNEVTSCYAYCEEYFQS